MFLHRCVPGFIVQGGGYAILDPASHETFAQYWNVPNYGVITNEFNVGRVISNVYGTIAMAKLPTNPDSASNQWFFNLANNSANLDNQNGGFTVFGKVVRGTNVLEEFNKLQANGGGVVDLTVFYGSSASLFSTLPVMYNGITPPTYADLLYVDITTLTVSVTTQADGTRDISWNSVSNKVNTVEYTTSLPPVWQTHKTIQGTGQRLTVTDPTISDKKRFYRVRVDY
jgi:cyclophilin family peptidyl-prolyl cis-trans isomerase